jgi:predicted regulator of Ras-like GTPase activity (Roadblock/LC7/MglB family)
MLTEEARNFNWLLETFVEETAGVTDAMAVSSDGVLIARSETLEGQESDLLCAIIAGTAGMAMAASSNLAAGALERVIITMERGFLFVSAIADGSCLGVVATRECDVGSIGYQTSDLVHRVGELLTPALRAELTQRSSSG